MKISNVALGTLAISTSPFLFVELISTQEGNTRGSGAFDLIYMIGWTCTVIGLLKLQATGKDWGSKFILYFQLSLLIIANTWNVWTIIDPGNKSTLYFILDFSWPLSNCCLLIVGIIVAKKAILHGWRRYSVLAAGLWLPFTILTGLVFGNNVSAVIISGIYSTLTWALMGYMIGTTSVTLKERFVFSKAA